VGFAASSRRRRGLLVGGLSALHGQARTSAGSQCRPRPGYCHPRYRWPRHAKAVRPARRGARWT